MKRNDRKEYQQMCQREKNKKEKNLIKKTKNALLFFFSARWIAFHEAL